ncbi:auxin-responsive protein IAA10-like isoform X2 [Phragmites australis]|uniref:auxin-responsive protein IAA10-like isoform X2 n=1 Tax=Phragmites australis TaxID=29695 RepID=UPI002D794DE9|nr:auxin-responsive protein IAA10-like isoform X2 [Phragmites australis]
MRGGAGPTAAFASGEPLPSAAAAAAEEVEENSGGEEEEQEDDELELGLCLGSKKQQPPSPALCRILTARDLQPGALSPDSSVSSSSPAAGAATETASKRARAEVTPTTTTSQGTVASGHPQSFGVVGWPPIRTFRMNSLFNQAKDNASETGTKKAAAESEVQKDKEESEKKGRVVGWVKVNMDGDVIGRKVDLNAQRSYKTLASTLELMFMKPSIGLCTSSSTKSLKLLDNSSEYQLTYEDRDGDWMLVGDVPWEMFVGSVKRLRIMRTSDANGLGPRGSPNCSFHKRQNLKCVRARESYTAGEA